MPWTFEIVHSQLTGQRTQNEHLPYIQHEPWGLTCFKDGFARKENQEYQPFTDRPSRWFAWSRLTTPAAAKQRFHSVDPCSWAATGRSYSPHGRRSGSGWSWPYLGSPASETLDGWCAGQGVCPQESCQLPSETSTPHQPTTECPSAKQQNAELSYIFMSTDFYPQQLL